MHGQMRKRAPLPAVQNKNCRSEQRGVTLSGLLNVLDGFSAPDNMLFVMTTNRIEVLDRALLRPGRIDYRLYFGDVVEEQKIELVQKILPSGVRIRSAMVYRITRLGRDHGGVSRLLLGLKWSSAGLLSRAWRRMCNEPFFVY